MTNVRNKKGINKTVTIFPKFVDKICDFSHKFIKYALPPPEITYNKVFIPLVIFIFGGGNENKFKNLACCFRAC